MAEPARIVFAGTPNFAVPALEALIVAGYEIAAVYTQPDRPAGRGRRLRSSPIKQAAARAGLPVRQPKSLRSGEEQAALAALVPTAMVVVAYGLLIPRAVLDIPVCGCINLHASLLPRWRGAAPIQRAILAGDARTGVCLMEVTEGLDAGPVIAESATPIGADDTGGSLHDRLATMGAELLAETLPRWLSEACATRSQNEASATYAAKLGKEETWVDWSESAVAIERRIRAFNPWPVARTRWPGGEWRLWSAQALTTASPATPGTVLAAGDDGIEVATGDGVLRVLELQLPGRRRQTATDLLNGLRLEAGARLG